VLEPAATAALVARARRGDAEACTALVRAHLRAAYGVALSIVGRSADAEDVAQDAMAAAFAEIASCREPERFSGWLLQIVRNRARNWLESRRLRDVAGDERTVEGVAPPAADPDVRDRLLAALARLSPPQREVVLLHDLDGWTHPEIAGALGCSETMSRQHLFQARRLLRGELAEDAPAEVNP
jgi:RNA polymerase sigma-70 factor (ECF subfamily)